MKITTIEEWIITNQPDLKNEYYKGWWDSIEFIRRLNEDFSNFKFGVIDSFLMDTPPPTIQLKMPLLIGRSNYFEVILKESWVVEPDWTVSIERKQKGEIELFGFVESIDQECKWLLNGFKAEYLYPSYASDLLKFSGSVRNKHLLYGLFQILENYEQRNLKG